MSDEPGTLVRNSQLGDQLLDSLALHPDPGRQGLIFQTGGVFEEPVGGLE